MNEPEGLSREAIPNLNEHSPSFQDLAKKRVSMLVSPYARETFFYTVISSLNKLLQERGYLLRPKQKESIAKIIEDLKKGHTEGLIKLPTGVGKTRLFGEIIAAIWQSSLVLVPRTALLSGTFKELTGGNGKTEIPGISPEKIKIVDTRKRETASEQIDWIAKEMENGERPLIIMTYQAFVAAHKLVPDSVSRILSKVSTVVSDEAHRSIGDNTARARENLIRTDFEDIDDDEFGTILDETTSEEILAVYAEKFPHTHLLFTATPRLGNKDVRDYFDHTFNYVTVQEVVEDGTLVLPRHITVGKAMAVSNAKKITKEEITALSVSDRFIAEDGKSPIRHAIAHKYLELLRENDNYLPGVAFCRDIAQADQICSYFKKELGIRAVRVTSNNASFDAGIDPIEAERMLNNNEIDIVVTVSKVAEWWDVPTLRAALWFAPCDSPARSIQGNGRIMRSIWEGSPFSAKNHENTYIIEPSSWEVRSNIGNGENGQRGGWKENDSQNPENFLWKMRNSFDIFLSMGELSENFLLSYGVSINRDLLLQKVDENGECTIDGEAWTTVTHSSTNLTASGQIAIRILETQSEEWFENNHAWRMGLSGSRNVRLYRKSAVEAILPNHTVRHELNSMGECEIDGEIWTSVTHQSDNLSASGNIALKILEDQEKDWIDLNHAGKTWIRRTRTMKLYRKSALEALLPKNTERYELDQNGECIIDGETWMAVTKRTSQLSVSWAAVLKIIKSQPPDWHKVQHAGKTWIRWPSTVKLYRKSAVEAIMPKNEFFPLNASWECVIDGEIWTSVTKQTVDLHCSWEVAMRAIEKQPTEWHELHQKGRIWKNRTRFVKIYRKSAVEAVSPKRETDIKLNGNWECEINGEIWMAIRAKATIFQTSWTAIKNLIDKQNQEWQELNHAGKTGINRSQQAKLYRKKAIEALAYEHNKRHELDSNGECVIDGEIWTAVLQDLNNLSSTWSIASYVIEQQSPEWNEHNQAGKFGVRHTASVKIYRKSAVEELLPHKLDSNGECVIDGEIWTAVTWRSTNFPAKPKHILRAINQESPEWHVKNNGWKTGKSWPATVKIYRKSAVLKSLEKLQGAS